MKIGIICFFLCFLSGGLSWAQSVVSIYPTPQEIHLKGEKFLLPATYRLLGENVANPYAIGKLKEILPGEQQKSGELLICIGKRGDPAVRKYNRMIPRQPEGYYLQVTPERIVLAGNDERGTFYAVQTLIQLLQGGQLPQLEISDYPIIRFRGVVEGFYGTPWSHKARLSQLQFYGRNKLNTYIYGPKDDPYHSCPNWRKPYPVQEAQQIGELVKVARQNEVDFVWAIHPGQDIKWNEEDRTLLLDKFEKMYQLGVRSFAVFFDDISGEGTDPVRQSELLNYIDDHFVKIKGDVTPLIMCPTEYNKSWSNPAKGYLATLGTKLNPSVQIMWTGDRVISDITEDGLKWINEKIKRPAYIWWNFPVSDYVRDHLLMGAVYGLDTHIGKEMSGFVTNPMEYAEASKPAIFSVADYTWNPERFDSNTSWKAAIRAVLPKNAAALQVFANHNSDLGPNGHGYRREESVEIKPVADRFLRAYRTGNDVPADFDVLADEFDRITEAADMLLTDEENKELTGEMTPWLYQFRILGESGREVLAMVKAAGTDNSELFMRKYHHVKALQRLHFQIDQTYNQNPYQPGIKSGSKVMRPLVDSLFVLAVQHFNRQTGQTLNADIYTSPHKSYSTVEQCRKLPVRMKTNQVIVSPMLEVVKWGTGEYVGIELDQIYGLKGVEADFGVPRSAEWLQAEISVDGENWTTLPLIQQKNQLKIPVENAQIKYIRILNKSGKEQEAYLKKFIVLLKK